MTAALTAVFYAGTYGVLLFLTVREVVAALRPRRARRRHVDRVRVLRDEDFLRTHTPHWTRDPSPRRRVS